MYECYIGNICSTEISDQLYSSHTQTPLYTSCHVSHYPSKLMLTLKYLLYFILGISIQTPLYHSCIHQLTAVYRACCEYPGVYSYARN